jgi:spore coat polysaccharide biosynthesis protein SpsF
VDVTVVVQARMGSTRLPGKVLRPLAGRPMLALMLARLAPLRDAGVIVATSELDRDDPIADLCEHEGVPCVRGAESDVLARFVAAADAHPADHIVRLTADCPLIDPGLVRAVIDTHIAARADYTSNTLLRTFPDGLDVEVMRFATLQEAGTRAAESDEREHVTPFVVRRPEQFRLAAHLGPRDLEDERWTVDTAEDFAFVEHALSLLGDPLTPSWLTLLAQLGERRSPTRDELVLRVDRSIVPDPGHRQWTVQRDRRTLSTVRVDVRDGTGTLEHVSGDAGLLRTEDFARALRTRLAADLQVRDLRHHEATEKDEHHGRDLALPR